MIMCSNFERSETAEYSIEAPGGVSFATGEADLKCAHFDLTQCIHRTVLESQLPHKTVNLIF